MSNETTAVQSPAPVKTSIAIGLPPGKRKLGKRKIKEMPSMIVKSINASQSVRDMKVKQNSDQSSSLIGPENQAQNNNQKYQKCEDE